MALIPEADGGQPLTKLERRDDTEAFSDFSTVDIVIRLGLIGLIIYWALKVVGPFVTVALWSAILVVALYPVFEWLAPRLRSPRLAAILLTLLCLAIVIGPVAWLGFAIIGGAEFVVRALDAFPIPTPPEWVKSWPLFGEQIFRWWTLAATDTQAILLEIVPRLKPFASKLLELAGAGLLGLLEFIAAIIIAGFLYVPGPRLAKGLRSALRRISGQRADEMMHLAGSTILNVSRGVVGIALLQSLLAGLGFVVAGIHGAGFLTFLALILGIVQIGAGVLLIPIIIWSWFFLETSHALLFTAYMIPVSLFDNIFRPVVMARGLDTPMPVILVGVIGGTLAYGISGLFLGPIILSVAWALLVHWIEERKPDSTAPGLTDAAPISRSDGREAVTANSAGEQSNDELGHETLLGGRAASRWP